MNEENKPDAQELLNGELGELIYIIQQPFNSGYVVLGAMDDEGTHAEMCVGVDELIQAFERGLRILKGLR